MDDAAVGLVSRGLMGRIFGRQIRTIMDKVGRDDVEILKFLAKR